MFLCYLSRNKTALHTKIKAQRYQQALIVCAFDFISGSWLKQNSLKFKLCCLRSKFPFFLF